MAKWADYLITAVRFNSASTHVVKVKGFKDLGDKVGTAFEEDRQTVIKCLERGVTYMTAFKGADGQFRPGAKVGILTVEGTKYLRTHKTLADNLDTLPTF